MHAGAVGAVKSAAVLCTAAIGSHSRNYFCFEPFLTFGSQRGFHPAVTEKHGGWNSSFLASPHSRAVLSCAIVGKHQLSRCLHGEGRGMFPVSGFFQISHHWSLTETPLFIITVILCCQVVMQNAYADIFIRLQYCLAVGDFVKMELVNSGWSYETVVSWMLWYGCNPWYAVKAVSCLSQNRTEGWVRRRWNGCWACPLKHGCRDVKIQPLKIAWRAWSSYILSLELQQA